MLRLLRWLFRLFHDSAIDDNRPMPVVFVVAIGGTGGSGGVYSVGPTTGVTPGTGGVSNVIEFDTWRQKKGR